MYIFDRQRQKVAPMPAVLTDLYGGLLDHNTMDDICKWKKKKWIYVKWSE